jgi:Zonular occludens toxin (Zot)
MIRIITGPLGAGKSLYCSMDIFSDLCSGKTVCTNIDVDFFEMARLAYVVKRIHLNPSQLIYFDLNVTEDFCSIVPRGTPDCFIEVYLDEIHLWFNSRDWQQTKIRHKRLMSYLTQSRKFFNNITFITQVVENVDSQFRGMAEWIQCIVPSSHMPLGIIKSLPVKFFFIVFKDASNGNVIKKAVRRYDKRFFKTYRSFQLLDNEMIELASKAPVVSRHVLVRPSFHRWFLVQLYILKPKPCDYSSSSRSFSESVISPAVYLPVTAMQE